MASPSRGQPIIDNIEKMARDLSRFAATTISPCEVNELVTAMGIAYVQEISVSCNVKRP